MQSGPRGRGAAGPGLSAVRRSAAAWHGPGLPTPWSRPSKPQKSKESLQRKSARRKLTLFRASVRCALDGGLTHRPELTVTRPNQAECSPQKAGTELSESAKENLEALYSQACKKRPSSCLQMISFLRPRQTKSGPFKGGFPGARVLNREFKESEAKGTTNLGSKAGLQISCRFRGL